MPANPDAAAAFIEFVLSDEGQAILAEYGFGRRSPRRSSVDDDHRRTMTDAPATTAA